ncbi:hypothetical protein ET475_08500 [Microbacterium protaetiae]|uniref:Uncharacterized protein n=1 Tax=Microbacterium protaetiae TaxID=2509458 RepID=A0A4P6EE42_9MICO|nr:hypothetical protein [Microbacterium protaetiae]QAY60026.1 hypothetical protein ET475_08500 [Microbacterium protaetiae]
MASFSWVHLLILLLAVAVIVLVLVLAVRSWRRHAIDGVIGVTLTGSALYGAIALIIAIGTVIDVLTSQDVTISVPVNEYWPQLPPGAEITPGPSATRVGGGFTTADLQVEGLSAGARVLWASGLAAGLLAQVAIAALIAVACFQLLRGAAFAQIVANLATVTAVVVLVGGIAAAVLCDIAGSMAAQQVLSVTSAQWSNVPSAWADWDPTMLLPKPGLRIEFPFWPVGAGLGFAALAAVLKYGTRLQRDTEGLV